MKDNDKLKDIKEAVTKWRKDDGSKLDDEWLINTIIEIVEEE